MKSLTIPLRQNRLVSVGEVPTSYVVLLNMFWLSIIFYSVSYVFSISLPRYASLFQATQIVCILTFFGSLSQLINLRGTNRYFAFMLGLFIVWQVILIVRGEYAFMDYEDTKAMFFDANYGIFCLSVPLISMVKTNMVLVRKLLDSILILSVLYLLFTASFLPQMIGGDLLDPISRELVETSFKFLAFPTMFFLLISPYESRRKVIFSVFIFILFMALAAIKARRGILMMGGFALLIVIAFQAVRTKSKLSWLIMAIYLLAFSYQLFSMELSLSKVQLLSSLFDKGLENTRNYVEECFFSSMTTIDWIIGKGYNGGYYCPGIDESIFKHGIRRVIETDYFQFILMGGLVNIVLLLMLMIPPVVLGLFYSNNLFSKAAASWILIWLVFLYPSNGFTFSIYHVSVWLMVSLCYNGSFIRLKDREIRNYLTVEIKTKKNREKA